MVLFIIVYHNISKFKSKNKVILLLDKKTTPNIYTYTDNWIIIHLFVKLKKANFFKTQVINYIYFEYKKIYLNINKTSIWPL